MQVVHLNDTDLFYVEVGTGGLPCLVMHGGLGFDHTALHPWLDPLGDVMHPVFYDHRGNGRSGRPPSETITFEQLCAPPSQPRDLRPQAVHCARRPTLSRGHPHRRFCGRCQRSSRAPSPAPKAWAARPPRIRRRRPIFPPGAYPEATGVLYGPTPLCEPSRPAFEGPKAFSRFCGKLARSRSSPVASSTAATANEALWGSTPIKTCMSAHLRFGGTFAIVSREGHSDFGRCSQTSFESLRAVLYGGTQA